MWLPPSVPMRAVQQCRHASHSLHSRYSRALHDLPWQGSASPTAQGQWNRVGCGSGAGTRSRQGAAAAFRSTAADHSSSGSAPPGALSKGATGKRSLIRPRSRRGCSSRFRSSDRREQGKVMAAYSSGTKFRPTLNVSLTGPQAIPSLVMLKTILVLPLQILSSSSNRSKSSPSFCLIFSSFSI